MMSYFSRTLVIALFLISTAPVFSKDLSDAESGGHLTIPDSWKSMAPPGMPPNSHIATNAEGTKSLCLFIVTTQSTEPMTDDSEYVKGFSQSIQDQGATITNRQHQTINGRNFYVITCSYKKEGVLVNGLCWITLADGHIYQISAQTRNDDPAKDAEFTSIINSFSVSSK